MENPKIKVKIVHSQSKPAWNIIGNKLGYKYKISYIPKIDFEIGLTDTIIKRRRKDVYEETFISSNKGKYWTL